MRSAVVTLLISLVAASPASAESFFDKALSRAQAAIDRNTTAVSDAAPHGTLIFSAPPRESRDESERLYRPIAEYLSQAIGRPVEYRYPGTWGVYQAAVLKNSYDLTFDEAHFTSYRHERLGHDILVQLPGALQYAVVLPYQSTYTGIHRLAGHKFCTFAPPDLGTLVLLDLFDNPSRQPAIVSVNNWEEAYQGVISGRCAGGVLPLAMLRWLDPDGRSTKVLFHSAEMPGQALSTGPRVSASEKEKIVKALLAPSAAVPTAALRMRWGIERGFLPANGAEYAGLSSYLRGQRGFF